MCTRKDHCTFYQIYFIDGTCPMFGGMELPRKCIHVSHEYELRRKEVALKRFKYVAYDIDGGKERKKIQLMTSHI
jgi:hypothetical protein